MFAVEGAFPDPDAGRLGGAREDLAGMGEGARLCRKGFCSVPGLAIRCIRETESAELP